MDFDRLKAKSFRIAREMARSRGIVLRPFRKVIDSDSAIGPEWIAFSTDRSDFVSVHFPIGTAEDVAVRDCAFTQRFDGQMVAISGSVFLRNESRGGPE